MAYYNTPVPEGEFDRRYLDQELRRISDSTEELGESITGIAIVNALPVEDGGDGTVEGDMNAMDWTGHEHADGTFLSISSGEMLRVGHKDIVYEYLGKKPVLLGAGGYASVSGDYLPISTSNHNLLVNIGNKTHVELDAHLNNTGDLHADTYITVDPTIVGKDNQHDLNILFDEQIGLREVASTGVVEGGTVIKATASQFNVAAGSGEIVDGYTDRREPTRKNISWDSGIFQFYNHNEGDDTGLLTVSVEENVADPSNSTIIITNGAISRSRRRTEVVLALVFYRNVAIDLVLSNPLLSNEVGNTLYDLVAYLTPEQRVKGVDLKPVINALSIYTTAGTIFGPGANYASGVLTDVNVLDLPAIGEETIPATFTYVLQDGLAQANNVSVIPFSWEENLGSTTQLVGNEATIHYVYRTIGGEILIQAGSNVYQNGKEARDSIGVDKANHVDFDGSGSLLFVGQIYVQRNTPDFNDTTKAGIIDDLGTGGTIGGTVPVSEFLSLSDVNETTYVGKNGQMPVVNEANGSLQFTDVVRELVVAGYGGGSQDSDILFDIVTAFTAIPFDTIVPAVSRGVTFNTTDNDFVFTASGVWTLMVNFSIQGFASSNSGRNFVVRGYNKTLANGTGGIVVGVGRNAEDMFVSLSVLFDVPQVAVDDSHTFHIEVGLADVDIVGGILIASSAQLTNNSELGSFI